MHQTPQIQLCFGIRFLKEKLLRSRHRKMMDPVCKIGQNSIIVLGLVANMHGWRWRRCEVVEQETRQ